MMIRKDWLQETGQFNLKFHLDIFETSTCYKARLIRRMILFPPNKHERPTMSDLTAVGDKLAGSLHFSSSQAKGV